MKQVGAALVLVLAVAGCGGDDPAMPDSYLVEYQISMDRMEVVPPASLSDSLVVKLSGYVGPDTRFAYDHAVVTDTPTDYELTLYGVRNDDPEVGYIPVVVEWQGREFVKLGPHAGTVRVVFHQPDGSRLEETVVVGSANADGEEMRWPSYRGLPWSDER